MWYEIWPADLSPTLMGDIANAGDDIQATTHYLGSTGWEFTVYERTTGIRDWMGDSLTNYDGSTAEWIVERPQSGSNKCAIAKIFDARHQL
jgi:hypothetical protein